MGSKVSRTKGSARGRKERAQDLPARSLGAEKAASVKGGLKMLTSAREAEEKAHALASGIKK